MGGVAVLALMAWHGGALAQTGEFDIAAQPLPSALKEFGLKTGKPVLYGPALAEAKVSPGVTDAASPEAALGSLLAGTGLTYKREGDAFLIVQAGEGGKSPQGASVGDVDALIVTAQKREENIQDVPIAISAFTQEDLTTRQVAGGPDLMTQIPNMTFTKTNFTGYSIQIRGIGTQAVSATTDPAVAVAFNNTPFIRNRFFEQEFFDLERVEVLRGPQGTLYGRNATAGVVNIISGKPRFLFEAKASADLSNYSSRRVEGMVNIPLVEDAVALRLAGAWTKREGYSTNQIGGGQIDGRDLWSTRLSLRVAPADAPFDLNLIWEHFQEDDDRLRSGKQLCHKDVVTEVGGIPVTFTQTLREAGLAQTFAGVQPTFSQGCERGSLYSPQAFQTPNGMMLPYYLPLSALTLPAARIDPYSSAIQSRDLRVIESTVDPDYRAKSDIGELQISFDLTDDLSLQSETSYSTDMLSSMQDFNRFNTAPGAWRQNDAAFMARGILDANGFFCDPQLGCSDRLVAVDLSSAKSRQFSQELRLGSDFDGPFNFSLGANFLRYDTEDKYYVFINSLSMVSAYSLTANNTPYIQGVSDNAYCQPNGMALGDPRRAYPVTGCIYIDPNPIESLNDLGHNYFLSKNPYKLISYAAFGEAYYQITDTLKITGGLRWTVDKKDAPRVLSWLLASESVGYPTSEVVEQDWSEPTGRLAIDWKPDLPFTDETLLYASYAHGYKAGGANPPTFARVYYASGIVGALLNGQSETRPKTFGAEFVDAFELGAKNTLLDGAVTVNLAAFYYDYKDYQISEIVERSAFNRNFDAEVWGLEIEADWRATEALRLGFKGGYEKTRIADGEKAIDLMDRTAGRTDWLVVRPFPAQASSCILPSWLYVHNGEVFNLGGVGGGNPGGCELAYAANRDPVTNLPYVANPVVGAPGGTFGVWPAGTYPGWNPLDESQGHNHGDGFFKDLSGNELPNAPNFTATITLDYTRPLPNDWRMNLHSDLHWQSQSWWRVFNDHEYNRLDEYFTMNLAAIFSNEESGWQVMAYVKNVLDTTAITGAFLLSDDTALVTNVFLTEPRLYGLRVTKAFEGAPLLGSFGERRDGPSVLTVELGGQAQFQDAPNESYRPAFLNSFAPEIDPGVRQDQDLDWGDGREVKVTWRPGLGAWKVSLASRIGEANQGGRTILQGQTFHGCTIAPPCASEPAQDVAATNYGAGQIYESEDHQVVDFLVGRDVGLGLLGELSKSSLAAGLRYANFNSASNVSVYGAPDWYLPAAYNLKYQNPVRPGLHSTHHEYDGQIEAVRDFAGFGPAVSWEASLALLDTETYGDLDLDWSLSGGVLFGKQRASGEGGERTAYYDDIFGNSPPPAYTPITSQFSFHRSKKIIVPSVGASLGLSYTVGATSLAAGYRWERYFDAIDGGIAAHRSYDRTIDGPYFKFSVGFGG